VIYSKTCEYAIRALACLARRPAGVRARAQEIGREAGVPAAYIAKIFQDLARHGVLESHRGKRGGFCFHQDPRGLSLWRVVELIDDGSHFGHCVMGLDRCDDDNGCPLHDIWKVSRARILDELERSTLASVTPRITKMRFAALRRARLNLQHPRCREEGLGSQPSRLKITG